MGAVIEVLEPSPGMKLSRAVRLEMWDSSCFASSLVYKPLGLFPLKQWSNVHFGTRYQGSSWQRRTVIGPSSHPEGSEAIFQSIAFSSGRLAFRE